MQLSERLAEEAGQEQSLFALAQDAVIVRAPTGEIVYWNRGAEETYGWAATEVLGEVEHDLLLTSSPPVGEVEVALRSLGKWEGDLNQIAKDGSELVVASRQVARRRGDEIVEVLAINRDVTEATRSQAELKASEERFRLMVEQVEDYAIFMMDPKGIIVSWNSGAERMKGYRADEIIGRHFSRFYPSQDVRAGKPAEELRVAAAAGHVEDEGWRVRKDGSRFWASVVITAVRDESGVLRGFGKVTRDFSERRRYEEQLKYQAHLLDRVRDAVITIDNDLRITGWNAGAEHLYGWRADEAVGRATRELLKTEHLPGRGQESRRVVREGGEWSGTVVQCHKDGRTLYVEASMMVFLGEATRIVTVNRDVSERKRALVVEERRRIARELHDSVSQVLFSMTMQARALELALNIDSSAGDDPVAAGIANIRQLTRRALAEMRALIVELRPDALAEEGLVAALRRHFATVAAREDIAIKISLPQEQTSFDPEADENLFRLAQEALNNVVKHAKARTVALRLAATADGSAIELEITDDGIGFDAGGIQPEHLGLTTMSERAVGLGGTLAVTSTPGKGTTVLVSLPGNPTYV